MIKKIKEYIWFLRRVNVIQFFYLNYLCKNVERRDRSKVIPYKHSVIDIEKCSKLYLNNGDIEIGCDRLKKSREETKLHVREGAIWKSEGGCKISYGSTVDVFPEAVLETGYFTMNCNSVIVVSHRVFLGNDVMIGRNVVIYDSDFHQILNNRQEIVNLSKPVEIGNHVWLGVNVIILKGASIGDDCVIGAQAVVTGKVGERTIYQPTRESIERRNYGDWDRKYPLYQGD